MLGSSRSAIHCFETMFTLPVDSPDQLILLRSVWIIASNCHLQFAAVPENFKRSKHANASRLTQLVLFIA